MGTPVLQLDIAIIGGGIAGLWALNLLRGRGYSAVLFEQEALGSAQTAAAQGVIHSGIKYRLSDAHGSGPNILATMPAAWRDCLAGRGQVDLRAVRILSEHFYLWTHGASTAPGGASWRAALGEVPAQQRPAPFQVAAFQGQVYRADEPVVEVASLVQTLAARQRDAIFHIDWRQAALRTRAGRADIALPHCSVQPACLLLAAGAGNAALIAALGATAPAMQRWPLQQVLVKHQYTPALFAHCIDSESSPRLTITSHRTRAGAALWSLGGGLATAGAHDEPSRLIATAQRELAELLPALDLGETQWRTLRLDRAEPELAAGLRADRAFVEPVPGVENCVVAWPFKLCLCPDLGDQLQRYLTERDILPRHAGDLSPLHALPHPPVAPPCWDTLFP